MIRARALEQSEDLHRRVRAFATERSEGLNAPSESFESLALAIARFQHDEAPGMARLSPDPPTSLEEIPAIPAEVFRLTRVATFPSELEVARFQTSGTTRRETGAHPVRTLETYDHLALLLAERSLLRNLSARPIIMALAEAKPGQIPSSSLTYMMDLFMRRFDGRSLSTDPLPIKAITPAERFLVGPTGVDLDGLRRAARLARYRGEPLIVLGTSFSFAALIEALDGEIIQSPREVRLMITGGFKGRIREAPEGELRASLARAFGARSENVLGEYGMTELTSQLYESWPEGFFPPEPQSESARALKPAWFPSSGRPGLYHAPPWLQVWAIDPVTGKRLPQGEIGLGQFIDLGNVDSHLAVLTEDRIRECDGGIELLGRAPSAPARGCSLAYEGLLERAP